MTEREAMMSLLVELTGQSAREVLDLVARRMESLPGLAPPVPRSKARRQPEHPTARRWLEQLDALLEEAKLATLGGLTPREESLLLQGMQRLGAEDMIHALVGAFRCHGRATMEERNKYGHLWRTVDHYTRESNHRRYLSAATAPASPSSRPPSEMMR